MRECNREFRYWGREHQQLPPDGEGWRTWLILGGRGAGKTRAGAEWVRARAMGLWPSTGPRAERIAIVAPTFDEARLVMIEGKSRLLAVHADDERPLYEPSKRQLTWANGTIAQIFSAEEPESLRGPQFDYISSGAAGSRGRHDHHARRGRRDFAPRCRCFRARCGGEPSRLAR